MTMTTLSAGNQGMIKTASLKDSSKKLKFVEKLCNDIASVVLLFLVTADQTYANKWTPRNSFSISIQNFKQLSSYQLISSATQQHVFHYRKHISILDLTSLDSKNTITVPKIQRGGFSIFMGQFCNIIASHSLQPYYKECLRRDKDRYEEAHVGYYEKTLNQLFKQVEGKNITTLIKRNNTCMEEITTIRKHCLNLENLSINSTHNVNIEILKITKLKRLDLSPCATLGLQEIEGIDQCQAQALETLNISGAYTHVLFLAMICKMPNLKTLVMHKIGLHRIFEMDLMVSNQVDTEGFKMLWNHKKLENLDISNTPVTLDQVEGLCTHLSCLKRLNISNCPNLPVKVLKGLIEEYPKIIIVAEQSSKSTIHELYSV